MAREFDLAYGVGEYRMMKIYTKTGDDGSTGLIGGARVLKSDRRVECCGTVGELNAALGLAAVALEAAGMAGLVGQVREVQNELFTVGAHLAAAEEHWAAGLPALEETMVSRLEMEIDAAESGLPPLRQFILPGGSEAAARLHVARTVCRRAERLLVSFAQDRPVPAILLTYLNRLGDWLFVQARAANQAMGIGDVGWMKK